MILVNPQGYNGPMVPAQQHFAPYNHPGYAGPPPALAQYPGAVTVPAAAAANPSLFGKYSLTSIL